MGFIQSNNDVGTSSKILQLCLNYVKSLPYYRKYDLLLSAYVRDCFHNSR